jgi:hypothetical protein
MLSPGKKRVQKDIPSIWKTGDNYMGILALCLLGFVVGLVCAIIWGLICRMGEK